MLRKAVCALRRTIVHFRFLSPNVPSKTSSISRSERICSQIQFGRKAAVYFLPCLSCTYSLYHCCHSSLCSGVATPAAARPWNIDFAAAAADATSPSDGNASEAEAGGDDGDGVREGTDGKSVAVTPTDTWSFGFNPPSSRLTFSFSRLSVAFSCERASISAAILASNSRLLSTASRRRISASAFS